LSGAASAALSASLRDDKNCEGLQDAEKEGPAWRAGHFFFSSINRIAGWDGSECIFIAFVLLELQDKRLDMRVC
jgi:hypothetical protein